MNEWDVPEWTVPDGRTNFASMRDWQVYHNRPRPYAPVTTMVNALYPVITQPITTAGNVWNAYKSATGYSERQGVGFMLADQMLPDRVNPSKYARQKVGAYWETLLSTEGRYERGPDTFRERDTMYPPAPPPVPSSDTGKPETKAQVNATPGTRKAHKNASKAEL